MRDGEHGLFVPPEDAQVLAKALVSLDDDRKKSRREWPKLHGDERSSAER